MIKIIVPTPLRGFTDGNAEVELDASSVKEAIDALIIKHPGLQTSIIDDSGTIRGFVNLFLNDDDIRMHDGVSTSLKDGDVLEILPAIAGGEGSVNSVLEWKSQLKGTVEELNSAELARLLLNDENISIVDVRTSEEWDKGHIPEAQHIDRGFLELQAESALPNKNEKIICYCQGGARSMFAANALNFLGYSQIYSLSGGFQDWKNTGNDFVIPENLGTDFIDRYSRHLNIPEVGLDGQKKFLEAKVLMIGAGGLGSPIALYLAAAGVGTLGIVDNDVVELSNLQRQIIHTGNKVGRKKIISAQQTIEALNPNVKVELFDVRLDETNVNRIFENYDIIVDGTDNFKTRYLINEYCVKLKKPLVHGSVYRFEGQAGVFCLPDTACYACLYPEAPPPELAPSCAEGGVLGVLPGVIGILQAIETLKLILNVGSAVANRSIKYDALSGKFRELKFRKDPNCACCGDVD